MDQFNAFENNNKRLANLKRWLAKPPRAADRARLLKVGDPPMVMREFTLDQLQPGLALEIDADTRDDAAEDGSAVCEYMLVFEAGERTITTHRFSVRSQQNQDDALAAAAGIEATKDSALILMQRHCEVMLRINATNSQQVVAQLITANQQLMTLNEELSRRVVDAYSREDQARDAVHALRELLTEPQPAEGEESSASDDALANALKMLAPILAQRLLMPGKPATPATPATPPPGE